ncbi:MAG TPA: HAD family hydrolase [Sphingomonas sp.]|nr:HAD family hydrolase [Sphingomonas sp.]
MKTSVRAGELSALLDSAPAGVRILSLDCFDTLLWRDVNAPADVFADLPIPGGGLEPRRRAEAAARLGHSAGHGGTEIRIEAIHQKLTGGDDAAAVVSVAAELAAERRHCFGFAPVIDLIAEAKRRGLEVIVVSDTYLDAGQLRALIADCAGEAVAAQIDRIFCSCLHGASKAGGLFRTVLAELGADPATILHLGDNPAADLEPAAALGINAAHLVQFDEDAAHRLRLEAAAASVFDPRIRAALPAFQPHRPLVAMRSRDDAAYVLGHDVLGPLLTGYARWLREETAAIQAASGRTTHLLFLLRDGHLPALIHGALFGNSAARTAEISRLTAMRAGLTDEAAVLRHLHGQSRHADPRTLANQLLLGRDETDRLKPGAVADAGFVARLKHPATLAKITRRSAKFADGLIAHLRQLGVTEGDAVVLADLGYNGSVQNMVADVLTQRMDLAVSGRYLLLREEVPAGLDKRGWFDTRNFDYRTLDALCDPIALVEQLCTKAGGSATGYKPDGTPIRADEDIKGTQSETRERVQEAAIAYAAACRRTPALDPRAGDLDAQRIAATGLLGRLLFLPSPAELDVLESFEHDFNCGSTQTLKLVDPGQSETELRRRGLIYTGGAQRMFLPGELRRHGLPLNLSLLATRRFRLDLRGADFAAKRMTLPVVLMDQHDTATIEIEAQATHDGYYAAAIPVGAARYTAAIRWGQVADWVELNEASFHRVEDFGGLDRSVPQPPIPGSFITDAMECVGGSLYRCSEGGVTLIQPPRGGTRDPMLLCVVFRPIVSRGAAAVRAAA